MAAEKLDMSEAESLKDRIENLRNMPVPEPLSNRHLFVGPPMGIDVATPRKQRENDLNFNKWYKKRYGVAVGDAAQRSHRNPKTGLTPTLDLMQSIAKYMQLPENTLLGKVPGGAHIAQTAMIANSFDPDRVTYIDAPDPRKQKGEGHFRNIWATDILERFESKGKADNIIFAEKEGEIPSAAWLKEKGVKQILGVGNETTTATVYNDQDFKNLMDFLDADPKENRALVDLTSHLGSKKLPDGFFEKADSFFSIVKAFAGKQGIGMCTMSERTREYVKNNPAKFDVDTGFRLAHVHPEDPEKRTLDKGPWYNPATGVMEPVINTDDVIATARSVYELERMSTQIGDMDELIKRSEANLERLTEELEESELLSFGVEDKSRRSASVALISVKEDELTQDEKKKAIDYMKKLLDTDGIERPNGDRIDGLNMAIDFGPYPGTAGDIRCWIGGVRPNDDIAGMVKIFEYGYQIAKSVILEERLAKEFDEKLPKEPEKVKDETDEESIVPKKEFADAAKTIYAIVGDGDEGALSVGDEIALKEGLALLIKSMPPALLPVLADSVQQKMGGKYLPSASLDQAGAQAVRAQQAQSSCQTL